MSCATSTMEHGLDGGIWHACGVMPTDVKCGRGNTCVLSEKVHVCVCVHVRALISVHVCIHGCVLACMCMCVHVCVCVHACVHAHVSAYVSVRACVCVFLKNCWLA